MIGCIPETVPVKTGNPDGSVDSIKSVEEDKDIVKKNSRKSNRAKKTNETE